MAACRVCFIGDSITSGTGDNLMLGWPGRICAAACSEGHDVTMYNLGIRGETSEDIKRRWREEAARRIPSGVRGALVFAFGLNDSVMLNGTQFRVELEQTAANARTVLIEARAWLPSVLIGPAPIDDTRLPPQLISGKLMQIQNPQIAKTNRVLAQAANGSNVPYLDLFTTLVTNARWRELMKQGDCVHPTTQAYDMLAQIIREWGPWRRLFNGGAKTELS